MGERSTNTTLNGVAPEVRPGSSMVGMNEQVLALIAAIDELRAAQDALAGALMRGPAPAHVDRVIADLLRDAQAAANSIRARGEQDAAAIRRLAQADADAFLTDLSHLNRQLDAAREQAGVPSPARTPVSAPIAAELPPPQVATPPIHSEPALSPPVPPPAPVPVSHALALDEEDPEPSPDELTPEELERAELLASLREEREGLKRELQRIQTFDPLAAARASSDDQSESWFSRLFGRRR